MIMYHIVRNAMYKMPKLIFASIIFYNISYKSMIFHIKRMHVKHVLSDKTNYEK